MKFPESIHQILKKIWKEQWFHALKELYQRHDFNPLLAVENRKDYPLIIALSLLLKSFQRWRGIPFEYIFKKSLFLGESFYINHQVLIPRPETEELAEKVISHLMHKLLTTPALPTPFRILDIGTGSGVLILTLAKKLEQLRYERPNLKNHSEIYFELIGIDCSKQALRVAEINQKRILKSSLVKFLKVDVLNPKIESPKIGMIFNSPFDLIVSNPPYIGRDKEKPNLAVVKYEPALALWGGKNGLKFYQEFSRLFPNWLSPSGEFFLELGVNQSSQVLSLFSNFSCSLLEDISKKKRFLYGRREMDLNKKEA